MLLSTSNLEFPDILTSMGFWFNLNITRLELKPSTASSSGENILTVDPLERAHYPIFLDFPGAPLEEK
jgi:hypothetical protein